MTERTTLLQEVGQALRDNGLTASFWPSVTAWITSAPKTACLTPAGWNASRPTSAPCAI